MSVVPPESGHRRPAAVCRAAKVEDREDAALQSLDEVDPDALSPRQALEALYRLKALRRDADAPGHFSAPNHPP